MEEIWKQVVGYEGVYEVSNLGRVKRVGSWSDGRKTKPVGILRVGTSRRYQRAVLFNKALGRKNEYPVHRLVMAAFVGPLPFNYEVNHKDGDKHNNRLDNLEYLTHSANQIHSYRVLENPTRTGSKHPAAKISEDDAFAIRALRKRGWKLKRLATEFGLSIPTVCWIAKNKAWTHI